MKVLLIFNKINIEIEVLNSLPIETRKLQYSFTNFHYNA